MNPNVAVIPTRGWKDTADLLSDIVEQLLHEGVHTILIDTNGVGAGLPYHCKALASVVVRNSERNIHKWWNLGLDIAAEQWPDANVAILNDDIRMDSGMVGTLGMVLDTHPHALVTCPVPKDAYAPRNLDPVWQIAGPDRRGLTGWAFMLPAKVDYRFPEELVWWYGDNDLIRTAYVSDRVILSVGGTWVEHVDGGSKTGDWSDPKVKAQLDADGKTYAERWAARGWK